jgi:alpha-tubulin suppressor-like RCC1 family protein
LIGGEDSSFALQNDGSVYVWGSNRIGRLGDGTTNWRGVPSYNPLLTGISSISSGIGYGLAVQKSDGTVWSWGGDAYGQLGNNDSGFNWQASPVKVVGVNGVDYLSNVMSVSAGSAHSLALQSDGTVWAWGWNQYGQIGDGTISITKMIPTKAKIKDVIAISAGGGHSLALKSDGTVWAWGANESGQLGDGTNENKLLPVQIPGLKNIIKIAAGPDFSLALQSDGTAWAWGANWFGQLGNGSTNPSNVPIKIIGLNKVSSLAAGLNFSLVLQSDGTVWACGTNWAGQLGNGTRDESHVPVKAINLTNIVNIAAGRDHALALKSDGTVWAWGRDQYAQLGDGRISDINPNPARILLLSNFYSSGTFTSSIINVGYNAKLGKISFGGWMGLAESLKIKARSSASSSMIGAPAWANCSFINADLNSNEGVSLSDGGCVKDGDRYVQYQVEFASKKSAVTPVLSWVNITAYHYPASATLTSSIFTQRLPSSWGPLTYHASVPSGTKILFEVSPDGGSTWVSINNLRRRSKTLQYRVTLSSDNGAQTPILNDVSITYNFNL